MAMSTYYAFEKFAKEHIHDLHNTKAQIRLEMLAEQAAKNEPPRATLTSCLEMLVSSIRYIATAVRKSTDIPKDLPKPLLNSKQT
jgi:hypothetical protein